MRAAGAGAGKRIRLSPSLLHPPQRATQSSPGGGQPAPNWRPAVLEPGAGLGALRSLVLSAQGAASPRMCSQDERLPIQPPMTPVKPALPPPSAPAPPPPRAPPVPTVPAGTAAKRFEVKKWNAVAFWSWDVEQDRCAICRNSIYEPSIEIQAAGLTVSTRSSLVWTFAGVCPPCMRCYACQRLHRVCLAAPRPLTTPPRSESSSTEPPTPFPFTLRRVFTGRDHLLGRVQPLLPPGMHLALAPLQQHMPALQRRVGQRTRAAPRVSGPPPGLGVLR